MLEELHIANLALIREVWLEFGSGLTVLTGETGAGKTALLGGLKLLLGERADSGAVRAGADEALVEGRLVLDGCEVLAKRRVGVDGRSRCSLDGEMATVGALAERLGPSVDLHGQHDHQALLSSSTHGGYLDRWAGRPVEECLEAYRASRAAWAAAVKEHQQLSDRIAAVAQDADYLRFVVTEIERVAPKPGEDDELRAKLPALQHAEKLAEAASQVAALLRGESGALESVARARETLARVDGIDSELDALGTRLAEIEVGVDDVGVAARAYRDNIDDDPASLDATLARLSELSGLVKKYGPTLDAVFVRLDEARVALGVADDGGEALAVAQARLETCEQALRVSATALDAARKGAAPGFASALTAAAADLAMEGARFEVDVRELPFSAWSGEGASHVEFLFAPSAAQPPRPLARIASGGEISRVMLALKSVLGAADTVETLVFDEIDAGIGGATATAVGARLAQLADTHQVLVVTHLAQVAVFADAHLVVRKNADGADAVTEVTPVDGEQRVAEISRMLSGKDSAASIEHARELLEQARAGVTAS